MMDTPLPLEQIREICERHHVAELSVFGSVLRRDFRPSSDVDFLVVLEHDDPLLWADRMSALEEDLERATGRRIDLVPKDTLKWVVRERILTSSKILYANR